jgi:phosphatidylglycerol:prolipoprotein diacylglycerol transferase
VLSIIVSFIYFWQKELPALKIADIMIPSVALGIFLTRIGCYMNGCCFGLPCSVPWGVEFPIISAAGGMFHGVHIHPTQLYSSFYGLVMFVVLLFLDRRKKFDGELLFWFLIFYGISRFTVDFFRYYETSMVLLNVGKVSLSVNQGISLLFMIIGGIMLALGFSGRLFNKGAQKTT